MAPPTLTGGILEVSELLTRATRTDDGELLFSDSFNDYGSMKPILFLLSPSCFFKPSRQTGGKKGGGVGWGGGRGGGGGGKKTFSMY